MKKIVAVLMAGLLSACSTPSPLSFSLEQMGVEDSSREGSGDVHYRTNIAIHGLGTPKTVGSVVSVPNQSAFKEWLNALIGKQQGLPDLLATPATTGQSRIIEQIYKAEDFKLSEYMAGMDKITSIYAELASLEGKLLLLQSGKEYASDIPPEKKPKNADVIAPQIQVALDMQGFTKAEIDTKESTLKIEIGHKKAEAVAQEKNLNDLGNKQNVWVWHWTMDNQTSGSADVGGIGNLSASSKKERSGYLVVSGLRISTLELGSDFITWLDASQSRDSLGIAGKPYLVTQQIGAEELAFREDSKIEKAMAAGASFTIAGLGDQLAGALKQQQIQLSIALRRALLTSVRGITKRSEMSSYPFSGFCEHTGSESKICKPCDTTDGKPCDTTDEMCRATGYAPFYTVRVEIDALKKAREKWGR